MNKRFTLFAILLVIFFSALVYAAATLMKPENNRFTPLHPAVTAAPARDAAVPPKPMAPQTQKAVTQKRPGAPAESAEDAAAIRVEMNGPTPAQKAENKREIARMEKALPGNMWIPEDPRFGTSPGRSEKIRKAVELSDKIKKGTATAKEKIEYYHYKIKSTQDRIDIINYIARRTAELTAKNGKTYLSKHDVAVGENAVKTLKRQIGRYKDKLAQLENPPRK